MPAKAGVAMRGQDELLALCGEMVRDMRREPFKVLRQAAMIACRAAIKYTPIERRRKVTVPPGPTKRGPGWGRPYVWVYEGKPHEERIFGQGFAKSGWYRAMEELHAGSAQDVRRAGAAFGDGAMSQRGETPRIWYSNDVPYIEDLDHGGEWNPPYHISAKANDSAVRGMERKLDQWARRFARKWSGR